MDVTIHCSFDASVTEQLLQNLGLHSTFDCAGSIGVAQRMHAESLNTRFVTEFIEVGIIGTVFLQVLRFDS